MSGGSSTGHNPQSFEVETKNFANNSKVEEEVQEMVYRETHLFSETVTEKKCCYAGPRTVLVPVQAGRAGIDVNFLLKLYGTTRQDSTRHDEIFLYVSDKPNSH